MKWGPAEVRALPGTITVCSFPGIEAGLVEMSLLDKPKSRLQGYRLTQMAKALQDEEGKTGK